MHNVVVECRDLREFIIRFWGFGPCSGNSRRQMRLWCELLNSSSFETSHLKDILIFQVCGVRGRNNRIVGGKETNPAEFPWIVGFQRQGKLYCSGTLITNRHVLTAAHCVDSFEPYELKVFVGGHNVTNDYTETRRVKKIRAHTDFDIFTFNNDVAVVDLDKPVKFGPKIQPACLPNGGEYPLVLW